MQNLELVNVPSFLFRQESENSVETTIQVIYYQGTISLVQDDDEVSINPECFEALVKAIRGNKKEAQELLGKR